MKVKGACIYIIRNKINNKLYIGYSTNYKRRKKDHFDPKYWKYQPNTYLYKAMKKYGRHNFHIFVIEDKLTKENALKLEAYYIKYFKQLGYVLYNLTKGGEGCGNPLNNEFEKQCPDCKIVKKHNEFDKNYNLPYKVATYCKLCTRKQKFIKIRGVNEYVFKGFELNTDTEKYCPQCKLILKNNLFHKDSSKSSGKDGICKKCKRENRKRKRSLIPIENYKHKGKYLNTKLEKYCPKCETVKNRKLFNKNRSSTDGLNGYCKACTLMIKQQSRKLAKLQKKLNIIIYLIY